MLQEADIFGCDPYWRWHGIKDPKEHVGYFAYKVVKTCWENNKEPHIWIQAMKFPKGKEKEIITAVQEAYQNGIRNMAAWSYDGGELLDNVYSEDSRKVWQSIKKAYMQLHKK